MTTSYPRVDALIMAAVMGIVAFGLFRARKPLGYALGRLAASLAPHRAEAIVMMYFRVAVSAGAFLWLAAAIFTLIVGLVGPFWRWKTTDDSPENRAFYGYVYDKDGNMDVRQESRVDRRGHCRERPTRGYKVNGHYNSLGGDALDVRCATGGLFTGGLALVGCGVAAAGLSVAGTIANRATDGFGKASLGANAAGLACEFIPNKPVNAACGSITAKLGAGSSGVSAARE